MDRRKLGSFGVMCAFMTMNAATSKARPDASEAGAKPVASIAPEAATTPTVPPDLDIGAMKSALGCATKATLAGCKLLDDFDAADAWNDVPTAETVFYGETNAIGGSGEGQKELFFLHVEAVPGSIQGSAHTFVPETPKDKDDATRLLAATRAGSAVPNSAAAKFMRERGPGKHSVVKTTGKSQTLSGTHVFMRKKNDRILVVEYFNGVALGHGGKTNVQADGWAAELFVLR